MLISLGS